jgi:pantetheine-phosphate adenylyltransferase
MTTRRAVYAGSFDPITHGHLWMIQNGAKLFDELIVAVGVNPEKRYLFPLEDRMQMLSESLRPFHNVRVDSFENLFLVRYAQQVKAGFILRGIRNEEDYGYERGMRYINAEFDNEILTIFLMPPREYAEISSSFVKSLVGPEGWEDVVRNYVPPVVHRAFLTRVKGPIDESVINA